ncbi:lanthionine synthetase-like protein [Flavobacterium sp. 9]|uniref:lanthionine synthetase LanC family protein n=1 Tax=Flavobacterium sp. 9 TaxID=2035198 RepID=UPI000C184A68|nr:lanthionine synthetase LanC family protein [Flavobacterium sp. 9]PIF31805.1 lanthionine synthetase-like protein [Flavobacterium sp. 9]
MDLIESKIHLINDQITSNFQKINEIGVLAGLCGLALFNFHYSRTFNKESSIGNTILEKCILKINDGYTKPTYCNGIIGFAWVINHLIKEKLIDDNNSEVLYEIDDYNHEWIDFSVKDNNFDFFHGTIGYLNYSIDRYTALTNSKDLEKIEKSITLVLGYLSELLPEIEIYPNGSKKSDIKMSFQNNVIFGLAHGISSIIFILNKISTIPKFNLKSQLLSDQYLAYLLKYKDDTNSCISLFPNFLSQKGVVKYQSALTWCSGDLGIGINLLNTSVRYNHKENYKTVGIEILEHGLHRTTLDKSLLKTDCLCHGYFGAYKIFSDAYKTTKKEDFLKASNYWLDLGLKNITINNDSDLTILNGLSGIGLTLLDIYSSKKLNWEECLFL